MRLCPFAIAVVGRVFVLLASLSAPTFAAQAPAQAQKEAPRGSVVGAERAVEKAAAERKINLSDGARRELAVEVRRQEAASPKTATPGVPPDGKVDELLRPIEQSKTVGQIDASKVKEVVANDKRSQVQSTLSEDVLAHAKRLGLDLPDEVKVMMVDDLEKQTAALSQSGLPVDTIKARNELFLQAISQQLQGSPVTAASYAQSRQALFQRFVTLKIESTPAGAKVKMNNTELGITTLEQSLEPNKLYQFEFALAGYTTAHRPYYVTAGASDVLREPLNPEGPAPSSSPTEPASAPEPPARPPFPWGYVVVGGLVLLGLLFLAIRR